MADYLAIREEDEFIYEDEDSFSKKAESGGAGQPVNNVDQADSPHGKPPADRFNRIWKQLWKFISGGITVFIKTVAKSLADYFFGPKQQ